MRAVLNGRMGLPEAEALGDLIHARSEAERPRATRLADGALSRALSDWRTRLIAALALCEAHLDFSDEGDVPGAVDVNPPLNALADDIAAALGSSSDAERLTDGFVLALVVTSVVTYPLRVIFRRVKASEKAQQKFEFIGKRVRLLTPVAGSRNGQAEIDTDGAPLKLTVRATDPDLTIDKGAEAVIVSEDDASGVYIVRPF